MMITQPYRNRPDWLIIGLFLVLSVWLLFSCNPFKHISNPTNAKDSARILTAAMKLLPPVQPTVTITHIDTLHDSTTIFKDRLKTITITTPDTCTDYFEQGESFGYTEGRAACPTSTREVDTIEIVPEYIRLQTQKLTTQINDLQKDNLILTTQNAALTKDKNKFMWLFIFLAAGGLTALTLWVKKKITTIPIPKI
jgi:hypothetical protein